MDRIYVERIPIRHPERGFGRHIRHDSRSRQYRIARRDIPIKTVKHETHIGALDQGNLGCCVPSASLKALSYEPYWSLLNGQFAWTIDTVHQLYTVITKGDAFDGEWPPTDTGSDALGAGDALTKVLKWISGYEHGFGLNDLLVGVQTRPGIMGSNWYSSMTTPRSTGEVRISSSAYIEGGHEYCVDGVDAELKRVWFKQSWGENWSPLPGGSFWMSYATVDRLLQESGDVMFFVPLSAPAPTPTPVPGTTEQLSAQQLFDQIKGLAQQGGLQV
jgi:hypothetical protein